MKKADELIDKYISAGCLFANATQCAIICVEDELELLSKIHSELKEIGDGRNRLYLVSLMAENESVLNELKSRLQ